MEQRRGITIFRAEQAPDLEATDMMSAPSFRDDFVYPQPSGDGGQAMLEGSRVKVLFRQNEDEGEAGFSLVYAWFKPHYPLPRHSHSADCLYYVISGSAILGSQVLGAGDGFFVPDGAPYKYSAGPDGVEVLEFRHARSFDMKITEGSDGYATLLATAAANLPLWQAMTAPR